MSKNRSKELDRYNNIPSDNNNQNYESGRQPEWRNNNYRHHEKSWTGSSRGYHNYGDNGNYRVNSQNNWKENTFDYNDNSWEYLQDQNNTHASFSFEQNYSEAQDRDRSYQSMRNNCSSYNVRSSYSEIWHGCYEAQENYSEYSSSGRSRGRRRGRWRGHRGSTYTYRKEVYYGSSSSSTYHSRNNKYDKYRHDRKTEDTYYSNKENPIETDEQDDIDKKTKISKQQDETNNNSFEKQDVKSENNDKIDPNFESNCKMDNESIKDENVEKSEDNQTNEDKNKPFVNLPELTEIVQAANETKQVEHNEQSESGAKEESLLSPEPRTYKRILNHRPLFRKSGSEDIKSNRRAEKRAKKRRHSDMGSTTEKDEILKKKAVILVPRLELSEIKKYTIPKCTPEKKSTIDKTDTTDKNRKTDKTSTKIRKSSSSPRIRKKSKQNSENEQPRVKDGVATPDKKDQQQHGSNTQISNEKPTRHKIKRQSSELSSSEEVMKQNSRKAKIWLLSLCSKYKQNCREQGLKHEVIQDTYPSHWEKMKDIVNDSLVLGGSRFEADQQLELILEEISSLAQKVPGPLEDVQSESSIHNLSSSTPNSPSSVSSETLILDKKKQYEDNFRKKIKSAFSHNSGSVQRISPCKPFSDNCISIPAFNKNVNRDQIELLDELEKYSNSLDIGYSKKEVEGLPSLSIWGLADKDEDEEHPPSPLSSSSTVIMGEFQDSPIKDSNYETIINNTVIEKPEDLATLVPDVDDKELKIITPENIEVLNEVLIETSFLNTPELNIEAGVDDAGEPEVKLPEKTVEIADIDKIIIEALSNVIEEIETNDNTKSNIIIQQNIVIPSPVEEIEVKQTLIDDEQETDKVVDQAPSNRINNILNDSLLSENSEISDINDIRQEGLQQEEVGVDWAQFFDYIPIPHIETSNTEVETMLVNIYMDYKNIENCYNRQLFSKDQNPLPTGIKTTAMSYYTKLNKYANSFSGVLASYVYPDDPSSFLRKIFSLNCENMCVYACCLLRLLQFVNVNCKWIHTLMNNLSILANINPNAYKAVMCVKFKDMPKTRIDNIIERLRARNEKLIEQFITSFNFYVSRDSAMRYILCGNSTLGLREDLMMFANEVVLTCEDIMTEWVSWDSTKPKIKITSNLMKPTSSQIEHQPQVQPEIEQAPQSTGLVNSQAYTQIPVRMQLQPTNNVPTQCQQPGYVPPQYQAGHRSMQHNGVAYTNPYQTGIMPQYNIAYSEGTPTFNNCGMSIQYLGHRSFQPSQANTQPIHTGYQQRTVSSVPIVASRFPMMTSGIPTQNLVQQRPTADMRTQGDMYHSEIIRHLHRPKPPPFTSRQSFYQPQVPRYAGTQNSMLHKPNVQQQTLPNHNNMTSYGSAMPLSISINAMNNMFNGYFQEGVLPPGPVVSKQSTLGRVHFNSTPNNDTGTNATPIALAHQPIPPRASPQSGVYQTTPQIQCPPSILTPPETAQSPSVINPGIPERSTILSSNTKPLYPRQLSNSAESTFLSPVPNQVTPPPSSQLLNQERPTVLIMPSPKLPNTLPSPAPNLSSKISKAKYLAENLNELFHQMNETEQGEVQAIVSNFIPVLTPIRDENNEKLIKLEKELQDIKSMLQNTTKSVIPHQDEKVVIVLDEDDSDDLKKEVVEEIQYEETETSITQPEPEISGFLEPMKEEIDEAEDLQDTRVYTCVCKAIATEKCECGAAIYCSDVCRLEHLEAHLPTCKILRLGYCE